MEKESIHNVKYNKNIQNIQENLIKMGFDITMINKIFIYFEIKTEEQAINYLIKINGKWQHPFILKENEIENEIPESSIDKSKKFIENKVSNLIKKNSFKILKEEESSLELCEICGDFEINHANSNKIELNLINNNNNNINIENIDNNNINNMKNNENDVLIEMNNYTNNNNENIINKNINNIDDDSDNNICQICMDNFINPITIETCNHKFCRSCFHDYLMDKINRNDINNFSCPKNKCFNTNLTNDFIYQFLTEQEYLKYQNFKSQNEIAKDPNKIFCPICNSYAELPKSNTINFDSSNPNYSKTTLKCIKNSHEFCSCGRPLHEGNCFKDEKEFKNYLKTEKIKKCPKCGFLIKKDHGCNHMTCGNPNCKFEFCWICMKESLPDHFNEGPCKGLQFVDEDSFMYKIKNSYPKIYFILNLFLCFYCLIVFLFYLMFPAFIIINSLYNSFVRNRSRFFSNIKINEKTRIILNYIFFAFASCYAFAYQSLFYFSYLLFLTSCSCSCFCYILTSCFRNWNNLVRENNNN